MSLIFVSYRRQDTQSATGRLCDKLQQTFDAAQVFHDIESIDPGADFAATIAAKVSASAVVLVMIGPRWLEALGSDGRLRLHDPLDYVRLEVVTALRRQIPVIPVLVEGAKVPPASALPDDMAALVRHQAYEISEQRWQYDTDRLVQELTKYVAPVSGPVEVAPSTGAALLRSVVAYPADFFQLLLRPRQQLLAFLKPPDVAGAIVFFVISNLIAAWLFVMEDLVESVPEFVLTGVPVAAFNLLAVVVPLHLAARIVGVRVQTLPTMVMAAYISSVFTVLVAAGVKSLWTGLILAAPDIGQALREAIYADPRLDVRIQRTSEVMQSAMGAQFFALFAPTNVIWLYSIGWLAVASSVIRDVWRVSGVRALAVAILVALMLALVVGFVGVVAWIGGS
jgi:hypothetical protein